MPNAEKIEAQPVIVEPVVEPIVDPKEKKPAEVVADKKPVVEAKSKKDEEPSDEDDEPQPDDKGIISLPKKAFMKKVSSMTARELKRIFGTSDVDQIVTERKELEDLRKSKSERDAKDEETRRATLKEEERLKEDNAKLAKANAELKTALDAKDEEVVVDRQQSYLSAVATKVVDEDSVDYALSKFRKHIKGKSNHEVESMSEKDVKAWFEDFAKEHPKHARAPAEEKKEPKKVGLTTAKKPETKPIDGKSGQPTQKRPMEMSKQELSAYKKERGLSY